MTASEPDAGLPLWVDALVTVRYDGDAGRVVFDIDGCDPWSAHTMLLQAAEAIYDSLPAAVSTAETLTPDDDE